MRQTLAWLMSPPSAVGLVAIIVQIHASGRYPLGKVIKVVSTGNVPEIPTYPERNTIPALFSHTMEDEETYVLDVNTVPVELCVKLLIHAELCCHKQNSYTCG